MNRRPHERFLHRVHRRRIVISTIENVGLCAMIAGVLALPVILVMLHQDRPIFVAMIWFGIVTIVAAVRTFRNRPSFLSTAIEADRQLELSDLLATAIQLKQQPAADAIAASIFASADLRCDGILPSTVILNRFGARAGGGIALALVAVLAIALIPSHPLRSADGGEETLSLTSATSGQGEQQHASSSPLSLSPRGQSDDNKLMSTIHEGVVAKSGEQTVSRSSQDALAAKSEPAKTDDANPSSATTGQPGSGGAVRASGGVASESSGRYSTSISHKSSPWNPNGTFALQPTMTDKRVDDKIPVADRDLVREYFDRN